MFLVFHDVRQPSDILYHKYKVTLKNVDDTLVTHTLFTCQSIYAGYLPKYAVSVSNLARAYLGIKGSHLYFPHYRQQNLKADTEIWMERPLKEHIIMNALRNVMYLLELRYFTKKAYSYFCICTIPLEEMYKNRLSSCFYRNCSYKFTQRQVKLVQNL